MKPQQFSVLTILLGLLLIVLVASKPYQYTFDKISVREFEMVDQQGKRRASIKVEPEGEIVFRLMDDSGTIRAKMSAGGDGSGLLLLDHNTNAAIHALAKAKGTSFAVISQDGKRREY